MPIQANIQVQVSPLSDDDVWFANSQAWNNYWNNVIGVVQISPIVNNVYVPVPFDNTIDNAVINVGGIDYLLVTTTQLQSLLNQFSALDTSYQSLRVSLRDAGLITNAQ